MAGLAWPPLAGRRGLHDEHAASCVAAAARLQRRSALRRGPLMRRRSRSLGDGDGDGSASSLRRPPAASADAAARVETVRYTRWRDAVLRGGGGAGALVARLKRISGSEPARRPWSVAGAGAGGDRGVRGCDRLPPPPSCPVRMTSDCDLLSAYERRRHPAGDESPPPSFLAAIEALRLSTTRKAGSCSANRASCTSAAAGSEWRGEAGAAPAPPPRPKRGPPPGRARDDPRRRCCWKGAYRSAKLGGVCSAPAEASCGARGDDPCWERRPYSEEGDLPMLARLSDRRRHPALAASLSLSSAPPATAGGFSPVGAAAAAAARASSCSTRVAAATSATSSSRVPRSSLSCARRRGKEGCGGQVLDSLRPLRGQRERDTTLGYGRSKGGLRAAETRRASATLSLCRSRATAERTTRRRAAASVRARSCASKGLHGSSLSSPSSSAAAAAAAAASAGSMTASEKQFRCSRRSRASGATAHAVAATCPPPA